MGKDLKSKAVSIKGKKYVLVADRIVYFNETYPSGSIVTELVTEPTSDRIIVKATVEPVAGQKFTGYSQATIGDGMVNKTSALENAETSAVGRALAMMGIGVIDSVASVDELKKANVPTGDVVAEKPWMSQQVYEGMLHAIADGFRDKVKEEVLKYRMKKEYKDGILAALAN